MAKKKSAATPAARRQTTRTAPAGGNGDVRRDPTHDEIAEAAYHRYLKRQGATGSDWDDWLEAERDLRSRSASSPKP